MKRLIVISLFALLSNSYAQTLTFLPRGLGLEVGFGYNQLKFQELPADPFYTSQSLLRDQFKLTPTIRLSWEKEILDNVSLTPFTSYSIIGGKSEKQSNGYEDEFTFKTIGLGLFASYKYKKVTFSFGGKYDRFIDIKSMAYGSVVDPISAPRKWNEADASGLFKKWAVDLGGRATYIINNIEISLEGWFSVTNLINKTVEDYIDVNSKRFQILVGYRL